MSKKIEVKAQPLSGMLSYQDGSVVTRTLIGKKSGTVTLFAFDEGQGLSEHTAPFDALAYVIEGKVEIIISGVSYHLEAEEMIIMSANEPHALRAESRFKMMLVMVKSQD